MREAEITCLTRMVRIPDLGLEMTKGDMERITEEAAEGSADLALMRRLNAVQVRWVRRYNTQRGIPIKTPGKRRSDNQPRPNVRPVRTPPSPETDDQRTVSARGRQFTPPEVDLEVLADKLAARFGGEIDRVIRAVRETRPRGLPERGHTEFHGTCGYSGRRDACLPPREPRRSRRQGDYPYDEDDRGRQGHRRRCCGSEKRPVVVGKRKEK